MTNHEMIAIEVKNYRGQEFTSQEIKNIVLEFSQL